MIGDTAAKRDVQRCMKTLLLDHTTECFRSNTLTPSGLPPSHISVREGPGDGVSYIPVTGVPFFVNGVIGKAALRRYY